MTRLGEALAAHARRNPDGLALDAGAQGRWNWRQMAVAMATYAAEFRTLQSVHPGPVAIACDQGPGQIFADLALQETGIASLSLPSFFTTAQRAHACATAGIGALVTDSGDEKLIAMTPQMHAHARLPHGTAKISFTSGSTGTPKGICLSAPHLIAVAQAVVDDVGAHHAGRHLALLPPGILLETVAGLYATILAGGTYVALPQASVGLGNAFRPDFLDMVAAIEEQRATSLIVVPEYLAGITAALAATGQRLPALTLLAVGGGRLSADLIARAVAVGLPVRQGYGLTECGSVVTLESAGENVRGSVGHTLGVNTLRLAEDGEIVMDGPLYLGTIGEPRAAGPFHTGDIGRIDEAGRLWIEGRKSNLIITAHGRNISPEWVESALNAQAAIVQTMVYGEGDSALSALIVAGGPDAAVAAAVAAANATLPAYARVEHWQSVPPFTPANGCLTANGRLRRDAISKNFLERPSTMPFFENLVATTRGAQADLLAVPQLEAGLSGQINLHTYIAYLTQAYHHVRHTVPLMQAARSRLMHKPMLVAALDEYIAEEIGHEKWILADIAAAGGDSARAVAQGPSPATAAMVAHAYHVIETGNPAAFFGMVFVLESTSIALATHGAAAVQTSLGLPAEAFTYLVSHGALDEDHMAFFADLMNRIDDAEDQQAIVRMAQEMFGLFGGIFAAIPMETADAAA